jgi:hypothetical protein
MNSRVMASQPSVDLITPCRNRVGDLQASLPSWLACDAIQRIIVVDFNSSTPVIDELGDLQGERVTVLRVENEPLWRQGRAQNVGLQAAAADLILKLDADIAVLDLGPAVAALAADPGLFLRGCSRQGSSSGLCLVPRHLARRIGGYHDHMAGWGGDDVDFYRRLERAGLRSGNVTAEHFQEVPQRMAIKNSETPRLDSSWLPAHSALVRQPRFSAFRNGLLARIQPQRRPSALRWQLDPPGEGQQRKACLKRGNAIRLQVARTNTELANILALHTYPGGQSHWQVLRQPEIRDLIARHRLVLPGQRAARKALLESLPARHQALRQLADRLQIELLPPG